MTTPANMKWKRIKTAPKDGTVILLYVPHFDARRHGNILGPNITFGYYNRTAKNCLHLDGWVSLETEDQPDYEGGYYQVEIFLGDAATHWMPIPNKPSTKTKSR